MSMFCFDCLKCGNNIDYHACVTDAEKICEKCGAIHLPVGHITGIHVCHDITIWGLKGTDKTTEGYGAVMAVDLSQRSDVVMYGKDGYYGYMRKQREKRRKDFEKRVKKNETR